VVFHCDHKHLVDPLCIRAEVSEPAKMDSVPKVQKKLKSDIKSSQTTNLAAHGTFSFAVLKAQGAASSM